MFSFLHDILDVYELYNLFMRFCQICSILKTSSVSNWVNYHDNNESPWKMAQWIFASFRVFLRLLIPLNSFHSFCEEVYHVVYFVCILILYHPPFSRVLVYVHTKTFVESWGFFFMIFIHSTFLSCCYSSDILIQHYFGFSLYILVQRIERMFYLYFGSSWFFVSFDSVPLFLENPFIRQFLLTNLFSSCIVRHVCCFVFSFRFNIPRVYFSFFSTLYLKIDAIYRYDTETSALVVIWNTSWKKCILWAKDIKSMFFFSVILSASTTCNLILSS